METVTHRSPIISLIILGLFLFVSACSSDGTATVTPQPPSDTPEVGASATFTPTEEPTVIVTNTPINFPTVTPHVYCDDVPESFLIIAERGRVTKTDGDETLNLRSGPGTSYDILVRIKPLEMFYVVDGVQCNGGYAWFQINYNGRMGWIAEGDDEQYYAEPYLTG